MRFLRRNIWAIAFSFFVVVVVVWVYLESQPKTDKILQSILADQWSICPAQKTSSLVTACVEDFNQYADMYTAWRKDDTPFKKYFNPGYDREEERKRASVFFRDRLQPYKDALRTQ